MNYSNSLKIEIFQFEYLKNRVLNFQLLKNQDKSLKYDLDDLLRQMVKKLNQNESSQL